MIAISALSGYAFDRTRNFVCVIEPNDRSKSDPPTSPDLSRMTTTYYDGLGRPVQVVRAGAGGDFEDITEVTEYGRDGKISKVWNPVGASGDSYYLEKDRLTELSRQLYGKEAYTEYGYDLTAERNEISVRRPGDEKAMTRLYEIGFGYMCPFFGIDTTGRLFRNGYYDEGKFRYVETTDQDGRIKYVYTDFDGRTIMEEIDGEQTCYAYDVCGRLGCVVSPEATLLFEAKGICDSTTVARLCTRYVYDNRDRIIETHLPGVAPTYYVYDKMGRLVMEQNGYLRKYGHWRFYGYDSKHRLAVSGTTEDSRTRFSHAWLIDEYKDKTIVATYSAAVDKDVSLCHRLENLPTDYYLMTHAYFYDDYSFWTSDWELSSHPEFPTAAAGRQGKPTGTAVLDGGFPIFSADLYDDRGRVIASHRRQYNGEFYERAYRKYDYIGDVQRELKTVEFPYGEYQANPDTVHINKTFSYYRPGMPLYWITMQIDGGKKEETRYVYNQIGQLMSETSGKAGQTQYAYDIQGRLISARSPFCEETLSYTPSGLISSKTSVLKNAGSSLRQTLSYSYDRSGRLQAVTESDSPVPGQAGLFAEQFNYDANGNILQLARGTGGIIQDLTLDYEGNRITRISDRSDDTDGSGIPRFPSGEYENPYAYDDMGRITKDATRDVEEILYDEYGHTLSISFGGGGISSSYAADGTKRRETEFTRYMATVTRVVNGDTVTKEVPRTKSRATDYYGDVERENGVTRRIEGGPVGFWLKDESGAWRNYRYVRNYMGSVAAVVDDAGKAAQQTFYYASGLPVTTDFGGISVNRRQHIGKEFSTHLGLFWYDNGARLYDPITMRFTTPDPLAGKFPGTSTYAYCSNNPVNRIDPDGRADFIHNGEVVGNDGVNDERLLVLKTTQKQFTNSNTSIKGAGIKKKIMSQTLDFIKENSGNRDAFKGNSIAYDNSIAIESNQSNRESMVREISKDNGQGGTDDSNNREYGGYINGGIVFKSDSGKVSSPPNSVSILISAPPDAPMYHSHPSGDVIGVHQTNRYDQPPSQSDIENAGLGANYCFGRGNGKVYIYDRSGVQAVMPLKYFITPKTQKK